MLRAPGPSRRRIDALTARQVRCVDRAGFPRGRSPGLWVLLAATEVRDVLLSLTPPFSRARPARVPLLANGYPARSGRNPHMTAVRVGRERGHGEGNAGICRSRRRRRSVAEG